MTYTGGYVLPGTDPPPPVPPATPLPADIEQAAVEQVAFWFQKKDKLGITTNWPSGGTYQLFRDQGLLQSVQAVLRKHQRFTL